MSDLTLAQLTKGVTDLAKDISRSSEAIRAHAKAISDEALDTARIADLIGAMKVDNATVGETRELAKIMEGVSEGAIAYAASGDTTARHAEAVRDQNQASHGGIQEAINRSSVAGIHDVDNNWLRVE